MIEAIENFLSETLGEELCVLICSMLPIIECRGAIPLGCFMFQMPWWEAIGLAFIGNLLPVPFILLFMRTILKWLRESKVKFLHAFGEWLYKKVEKHKGAIEKHSYWALILFIGIPLPGTGAWTGSLIASVLHLDFKKSLFTSVLGVALACTVVGILTYVFNGLFVA